MKMRIVFTTFFALVFAVMAVSAQEKTTNFTGNWELDVSKSKLGERSRVESMTMNVTQTGYELKVDKTTKRALRSESEGQRAATPNGGKMPEGMGRPVTGNFMGGDMKQMLTYSLDGKETKDEIAGIPGATSVLKARWEKGGKLMLSSSSKAETPMGERTMTVNETWSLSADGKTLTVVSERDTPRGKVSTEMLFVKK